MEQLWPFTSSIPILTTGEVHIWSAQLDQPAETIAHYWQSLAPEERERADRFHFDRHRRRYIIGRGILRERIGLYLKMPPASIELAQTAHGKPYLIGNQIYFNVSHSENLGLFAFCRETAVGVDVEKVRPMADLPQIAQRFFAPKESAVLFALPPEQQTAAFFRCWTRKEAFVKAVGEGLSYPLDAFEVTLTPDAQARFIHIHGDSMLAARWHLHHLQPASGYLGALALLGYVETVQCWQLKQGV